MKTLKSLEQLKKHCKNQITAQDVLNGNLYGKDGWESVKIAPELRKEIAESISELYGGRSNTKANIRYNLIHGRPQHWGLTRTFLESYGWTYCAGQDYTVELQEIRNKLK